MRPREGVGQRQRRGWEEWSPDPASVPKVAPGANISLDSFVEGAGLQEPLSRS